MSPEEAKLQEAIEAVGKLGASVDELAQRANVNRDNIKRGEVRDRWLAASVALDIILSLALIFAGYFIDSNQNEIGKIQQSQQELTEVNRSNQCAMVNMFLSYSTTVQRSTTLTEEEKNQRLQAYAVIQKIHDDLKCANE
jgi:hypothetical protein